MEQNLKQQLKAIFSQKRDVLAAYLIGSAAKGQARAESDFDLAILVNDKKTLADNEVYDLIRHLSFPKDLDLSVIDKKTSPLFLFEIIRGKRIYERKKEEIADFEAKVLYKYYDTAQIRNIYYSHLKDKFSDARQ